MLRINWPGVTKPIGIESARGTNERGEIPAPGSAPGHGTQLTKTWPIIAPDQHVDLIK
jgi:hypothetical protein